MISDQANFLQSLGWATLNSLWQMALLWIVFQSITGLVKLKSSLKSALASSLLIAGFAWYIYTFFITFYQTPEIASFSTGILNIEGDSKLNNWFLQILPILSIVYLILLLFPLLRFIRNYRYVQIIRKYGLSKIDIDAKIFVNKIASHLGITKKVQIWISELVSTPVTIGFLKPVILIPLAAINQLSTQQLEAILLHELAHIKRFDYLINLVINFIQTILYFNPFVKAFLRTIETEREKSCDEMVLQFQYNSHEYASALLMLEKVNQVQKPLAIPISGNKNDLINRIENILNIKKKNKLRLQNLKGLFIAFSIVCCFNFLFFITNQNTKTAKQDNILITELSPISMLSQVEDSEQDFVLIPKKELPKLVVINTIEKGKEDLNNVTESVTSSIPSEIINVAYTIENPIALNRSEQEQIKKAVEASKKIIENNQWKSVENDIADVFTEKEKEALKANYQKEIDKFDWSQWEKKLGSIYDNINWEKVNIQFNNAVNQIRIDSLQDIYQKIAVNLSEVQKELSSKKLHGIPDTDISIERIIDQKELIKKTLDQIQKMRTKKIVQL